MCYAIHKMEVNVKILVSDAITCVSYTKDGQCILASCADNAVRLLEKLSGEMLGEYVIQILKIIYLVKHSVHKSLLFSYSQYKLANNELFQYLLSVHVDTCNNVFIRLVKIKYLF